MAISPVGRDVRLITPQPVRGEINRLHLLQSDESASVTFLEAPSGYGKTTVAAQYARNQPSRSVIWASCTTSTADAHALAALLAQASQKGAIPLPAWAGLDDSVGPAALVEALVDDLNSAPQDLLLVVDHAEHLGVEAAQLLTALAERLGPWHHTWVNTHPKSHVEFTRLLAAGVARRYGLNELRFSNSEAQEFIDQLALPIQQARHVLQRHQLTNGWAAVLALSAVGSPQDTAVSDMVETILKRMPLSLRELILGASVVEEWTDRLPEQLGLSHEQNWITEASRWGLPVREMGNGIYRVDDLTRDILDQLLRQDFRRYQAIHAQAAARAHLEGDIYLAVLHATKAEDFELAQNLIENGLLPRWQRQSTWDVAANILGTLPITRLRPGLRAFLGLALGEIGRGKDASAIYQEQLRSGEQTAITYFGMALYLSRQGKDQEGLTASELGLLITETPYERIQLLKVKSSMHLRLQQLDDSEQFIKIATREAQKYGDPSLVIAVQTVGVWLKYSQNDFEAALSLGDQVLTLSTTMGFINKSLTLIPSLISNCLDTGKVEKAENYSRYLTTSADNYPFIAMHSEASRGHVELCKGNFLSAFNHYYRASEIAEQRDERARGAWFHNAWFARTNLNEGPNLDSFIDELTLSRDDSEEDLEVANLRCGRAILQGKFSQALEFLDEVDDRPNRVQSMSWSVIRRDVLRAEAKRRLGVLEKSDIDRIVHGRHPAGLSTVLCMSGRFAVTLGREVIRRGWSTDIFGTALKGHNIPAPEYILHTLGRLELLRGEQRVKAPARALELLAYLALHGPTALTALASTLAPNSTSARNRVQRAKADLAKFLAADLIETVTDSSSRYRLTETAVLHCDAADFLDSASPSETFLASQSEFLPGLEDDWVTEIRGRLRRHAVALQVAQAQVLRRTQPLQAQVAYERALQLDPEQATIWDAYQQVGRQLGDAGVVRRADRALEDLSAGLVPAVIWAQP